MRSFYPRALPRLLIVLCAILIAACATPLGSDFDKPEVELVGLAPMSSENFEARFKLRLRVINPNSTAFDIEGMHYEVFLRDRKVLSGVSAQAVALPAYGETVVELEATASMLGSLGLLRDLMEQPPETGLPYRLKTKLSLAGMLTALRLETTGAMDLR